MTANIEEGRKDRPARISIITVCFRAAQTLEKTIRSVVAQNYPDIEYIIVDGGSRDGTVDIIRKYEGSIAKWVSEKDAGIYDAMNKGIRMATGEWIGILNSDDTYVPGALHRVNTMASQEEADVLYGDIRMMHEGRFPMIQASVPRLSRNSFWHMPVQHPATFVRRRAYEQDGVFRTDMRISADYEFMLRLYMKNRRFHYCREVWVEMNPGGLSDNRWKEGKRELRMAAEFHGVFRPPLSLLFRLDVLRSSLSGLLEKTPVLNGLQQNYRNLKAKSLRRV